MAARIVTLIMGTLFSLVRSLCTGKAELALDVLAFVNNSRSTSASIRGPGSPSLTGCSGPRSETAWPGMGREWAGCDLVLRAAWGQVRSGVCRMHAPSRS